MSRLTARGREVLDNDFLRTPDARWREAVAEVQGVKADSPEARQRRREHPTRRAVKYLQANGQTTFLDDPPRRVLRYFADIWAAHRLYDRGGLRRVEVDARVLAGQSPAEIAGVLGLDETAVRAYLDVHFQVMDRLWAGPWLMAAVITPAVDRYGPEHGDIPGFWLSRALRGRGDLELAMAVTGHRAATQTPEILAFGRLMRLLRTLPPMNPFQEIRLRSIFWDPRGGNGSVSSDMFRRLRKDPVLRPLGANLAAAEKMLIEAS